MATPPDAKLPDLQTLCVATPLYAGFPIGASNEGQLFDLITQQVSIDCFCVGCDQPSVFLLETQSIGEERRYFQRHDRIFTRECICTRKPVHRAYFHFSVQADKLTKIGQSPSLADLSDAELRRYKPVLDKQRFNELSKAVGLASHGVGIGSFVYLRRIFEGLVADASVVASRENGWSQEAFERARMEEKIDLVKDHLPSFLVEQKKVYGVLSLGIHSLSEELCLESFPVVRVGIELMLEEKLAEKIQSEKAKAAAAKLQEVQRRLAGS